VSLVKNNIIYLCALAHRHRWLAGLLQNSGEIELDPIAMSERLRQLFAITAVTEWNFLTQFLLSNGILQRQWNGGNQAW